MSYTKPVIELLPNPVGIDFAIQELQGKLAARLPWLHHAFGRCSRQLQATPRPAGGRPVLSVIPEVYYRREPLSLMINDNLVSYCFFNPLDPVDLTGITYGEPGADAVQKVDIIFWANLHKIDPAKKYNFVEELRRDAIAVLKDTRFNLRASFLGFEDVFKPFTITDNFREFLKPPFAAFKINGEITFDYLKNC